MVLSLTGYRISGPADKPTRGRRGWSPTAALKVFQPYSTVAVMCRAYRPVLLQSELRRAQALAQLREARAAVSKPAVEPAAPRPTPEIEDLKVKASPRRAPLVY
jgi:hypothetical protein